MPFHVFLTRDAENDIRSIYEYVANSDSVATARDLYAHLKAACLNLAELPQRGHIPPELARVDIRQYLEVHFKPYRIIYQIMEHEVYIHCILDGRRDLQTILQKRLLA